MKSMLRVPMLATAVVVAVVAYWWLSSWMAANRKLAAIEPLAQPRGSYRIVLAFAPERFHQLRLQEAGRMVEVRDRTVSMMDVSPDALRAVAGEYWVDAVHAWDGR